MDYRLSLMSGTDLPLEKTQLVISQPTLKKISYLGETDFFVGVQLLCIDKSMIEVQDKSDLDSLNNFQIFMMAIQQPTLKDKKQKALQVLKMMFPKYQIYFTPAAISFSTEEETVFIENPMQFEELQDITRQMFCLSNSISQQASFNPGDAKAKEIADKLMRARERVAKQKQQAEGSVLSQYVSVLTIGLSSMSLNDCLGLTIYQLYDLVERYHLYIGWDIDIRARLAGGSSDKEPDNWMKNIH